MSYSVSHKTENTKMAEVMAKNDGGGLSGLIIRLIKREWRMRLLNGEVTKEDLNNG